MRHSQAETFQRQALEMARRIDSGFEGAILTSLANTIATQNLASSEAESLHRQAITAFESHFGTEHWRVGLGLNNLGEVLEAQGQLEESERVLLRSRKLYVAAFGGPARVRFAPDGHSRADRGEAGRHSHSAYLPGTSTGDSRSVLWPRRGTDRGSER